MLQNIAPIIVVVLATALVFILQRWRTSNYDYQCEKCGAIFSLSAWQSMLTPHAMGRKLVRCPNCGQMSWVNPIPKDKGS